MLLFHAAAMQHLILGPTLLIPSNFKSEDSYAIDISCGSERNVVFHIAGWLALIRNCATWRSIRPSIPRESPDCRGSLGRFFHIAQMVDCDTGRHLRTHFAS